jgi:glycosyltransferase involved in cell wall biosynthesis
MIKSIQIGLEWFPEQGGGLDRYYHDCCQYLPQADVDITGLLAGSPQVIQSSHGKVTAFASLNDSLLQRWLKMRTVFSQTLVEDQYDLIVSHFALYTFPILNQLKTLPLCYRAANFSVVPTIALEGFGLIVVESLAAGTPVLGTPVGGIPEILRPFSEDLVFEGCNPEQLATGIIEALSGDRILPSSQACLNYVTENYHWHKIAQQIKLVYQSALN